jgi:hypothetical protein
VQACVPVKRSHASAELVAVAILVIGAATACGDDDDVTDDPSATDSPPETVPPQRQYETVPEASAPAGDGEFLAGVLADDTVSATELEDAYGRFVTCLDDGGGYGRFAFDVGLRTGLVVDWSINPDDPDAAADVDELGTACSQRFLGDLTELYNAANPPGEAYLDDVRNSVIACLETVSPTAAANFPDSVSVDTTGSAASVAELQLSAVGLLGEDASSTEASAVNACIASLGAAWRDFGEAPPPPPTTS